MKYFYERYKQRKKEIETRLDEIREQRELLEQKLIPDKIESEDYPYYTNT